MDVVQGRESRIRVGWLVKPKVEWELVLDPFDLYLRIHPSEEGQGGSCKAGGGPRHQTGQGRG